METSSQLIVKMDVPDLAGFQVVDANDGDLCNMTSRGWRLVAIIHEQVVKQVYEETQPNQNGYRTQITKNIVMDVARYLIGREKESVLDDVSKRADDAEAKKNTAESTVCELKRELTKIGTALNEQSSVVEKLKAGIDTRDKTVFEARKTIQKFEGDIGKIRSAIGEIRMKEILEGAAK
jgi:septal ring factor EnvC (AmiA/AmiB activator)